PGMHPHQSDDSPPDLTKSPSGLSPYRPLQLVLPYWLRPDLRSPAPHRSCLSRVSKHLPCDRQPVRDVRDNDAFLLVEIAHHKYEELRRLGIHKHVQRLRPLTREQAFPHQIEVPT